MRAWMIMWSNTMYIYMYIHHSCVMYVLCRIVVLSYPGDTFLFCLDGRYFNYLIQKTDILSFCPERPVYESV